MNIVFELIGEIFFEMLGDTIASERVSKWARYVIAGLLCLGLATLFTILFFNADGIGFRIFLAILILGCIAMYVFLVVGIFRSGTLRLAKKEELPEILKMYRSVIGKNGCDWSVLYPNEVTLHEDFCTNNLYVLYKGKKLIGAVSVVSKNALDDLDCWHHRKNTREIDRIVIAPMYQNKGYGKHLIRKLCIRLDRVGCQAVHLLINTENNHALNLCRETGFHCKGQCERYDHTYCAYEKKL